LPVRKRPIKSGSSAERSPFSRRIVMGTRHPPTAYYFTLEKTLEPELEIFARRCLPRRCFVYKDDPRSVTIAFSEADDAMLFMTLFDGEIRDEYKVIGEDEGPSFARSA
jgi:hypothetical protein